MRRRTRIVATLGAATDRPGVLEQLLGTGIDVVRINFSHGTAEEHHVRVRRLRELTRESGQAVAILGDLPGPKLRVLLEEPRTLEEGEHVTLGLTPDAEADLHVTEPEALETARAEQRVLLDDGRLQMVIDRRGSDHLLLRVVIGGELHPSKGVNLPDTDLQLHAVTDRDFEALRIAAELGVDWLALSFVRDGTAASELRGAMRACNLKVPILAKIEKPEAVRHSAAIIDAFDGIMVARGDLGVEIDLERVPRVQKMLINQSRAAGKPVITATDMLDSMRYNPRPTRAEASDVANAVYDGSDAVMLSGETAVGNYPTQAVACMDRIVREVEKDLLSEGYQQAIEFRTEPYDVMTAMACELAHKLEAHAIIAPTASGRTARMIARHRPAVTIVSPAASEAVVRRLGLVWGVQPVLMNGVQAGDDRLDAAVHAAFEHGAVREGSRLVLIAGHPIEKGPRIPTIRCVRVGPNGTSGEAKF